MKLVFAEKAWEDYVYWEKQDKRMVKRINEQVENTLREPFTGIGKPDPLEHALAGCCGQGGSPKKTEWSTSLRKLPSCWLNFATTTEPHSPSYC